MYPVGLLTPSASPLRILLIQFRERSELFWRHRGREFIRWTKNINTYAYCPGREKKRIGSGVRMEGLLCAVYRQFACTLSADLGFAESSGVTRGGAYCPRPR